MWGPHKQRARDAQQAQASKGHATRNKRKQARLGQANKTRNQVQPRFCNQSPPLLLRLERLWLLCTRGVAAVLDADRAATRCYRPTSCGLGSWLLLRHLVAPHLFSKQHLPHPTLPTRASVQQGEQANQVRQWRQGSTDMQASMGVQANMCVRAGGTRCKHGALAAKTPARQNKTPPSHDQVPFPPTGPATAPPCSHSSPAPPFSVALDPPALRLHPTSSTNKTLATTLCSYRVRAGRLRRRRKQAETRGAEAGVTDG